MQKKIRELLFACCTGSGVKVRNASAFFGSSGCVATQIRAAIKKPSGTRSSRPFSDFLPWQSVHKSRRTHLLVVRLLTSQWTHIKVAISHDDLMINAEVGEKPVEGRCIHDYMYM